MIDLTVFEDMTIAVFLALVIMLATFYFKAVRPIDKKLSAIEKQGRYNVVFVKALRAICKSIMNMPEMNNDKEVEEAWNELSNVIIEHANLTREGK
ncbi:MAG: hypothetical protein FWF91_03195 [Coriobacteriia bacterium]|nr:hypothetical protein [Coriobacteriia bacterium]